MHCATCWAGLAARVQTEAKHEADLKAAGNKEGNSLKIYAPCSAEKLREVKHCWEMVTRG